ncbi:MAG: KH domain-containing protein [Candidatus Saccharimonadales bacterium]
MSSIDQQFVEFIVKSLVGKPDAVVVERRIDEKGVLLELTVDPEDLGRVIGKRGATAQSLRTLLRALGTKNDARYNLKIVDNGEPRPEGAGRQQAVAFDDQAASQPKRDDDMADLRDSDDQEATPKRDRQEPEGNMVSKTRRELEELDDLDV